MRRNIWVQFIQRSLAALLVVVLTSGFPSVGNAQSRLPALIPARGVAQDSADLITLAQLNQGELSLQGPFDSASVGVVIPATWQLRDPVVVKLNLSVFVTSQGVPATSGFGGLLIVLINDQQIGVVNLDRVGDRTVELPVPQAVLKSRTESADGRINLGFRLDSGFSCNFNQQINIVIHNNSGIRLPHTIVSPPTDLALLPRPIYQRSFEPDSALLVLPDSPAAAELQAALAVVAGFGNVTNGRLLLSMTTASKLSQDARGQTHLIFVGKPAAFGQLASVAFPAKLGSATITAAGMGADDGVLQMIVSPWNPARVLVSVSGNSDAAIIKAGQALSNSAVRSYVQPNLALVTAVNNLPAPKNVAVDRTFTELGYGLRTITDRSSRQAEIQFDVPYGQVPNGDAFVKIYFSHSAMINFEQSGATVLLNDQPVGSIQFSAASTSLTSLQFGLPHSLIRPGTNTLRISALLNRYLGCSSDSNQTLWLSIWPESSIHLPLGLLQGGTAQAFSLAGFPSALMTNAELSNLVFVLAKDDLVGWNSAAQMAFYLGDRATGAYADLTAAYADALPDSIRDQRDLVLVGRASRMPIIASLNSVLPAPFDSGGDFASERGIQIEYRIAPGSSIGYLEAVPSPWNAQRGVLLVMGSDDAGVSAASTALLASENRGKLIGNLAVIAQSQLITARSTNASLAPAPAVPLPNPPAVVPSQSVARPDWIFSAILVAALLLVVVIAAVVVGRLRKGPKKDDT